MERGGPTGDRPLKPWLGATHILDHGYRDPLLLQGAPVCPQLEREGCGYPAIGCFRLRVRVRLGTNVTTPFDVGRLAPAIG